MTMFGLKEADVAALVRTVTRDDLDREALRLAFARATWTGLAEPGDGVAGLLIAALGADGALEAVIGQWPPERLRAALAQAGVEDLEAGQIELALERWKPRLDAHQTVRALQQAARFAARLITPELGPWPTGVDDLAPHTPVALWCRGTDAALATLSSSIALVGARASTGYGEHVTMEASAGLVDRGYTIVSGAAYGIDGVAHRTALASHGTTVAFLAGGVDRFYPAGHDALLTRIAESGAVVSELPCGEPPTKWRFLQRNRLIAASSLATIVLEAGWRSGSLNTANHAATLGRALGAVPGPVTSPASAGCHRLIREFNAVCVTTPDEMAELAPLAAAAPTELPDASATGNAAGPTSDETRVLDALSSRTPYTAADVASRAGLSLASVQAVLGRLDLEGRATERERGWVRR